MSVSTDAILCYGFDVGGDHDMPDWMKPIGDDKDFDFDDFVVSRLSDSIKQPGRFDTDEYRRNPELKEQWKKYWADKKAFIALVGVSLVRHCSGDCPMYILAAKASITTAHRGSPKKIHDGVAADPNWRSTLESFCEKTGIYMQEPSWILCSDWS